ncbi:hypothetical protein, partial [Pseudomonas asplenii]|uniref:hypothetical protein n=1 Tax=Pseudomonas asplenii TaxID=53407 RepID=UPI00195580B7
FQFSINAIQTRQERATDGCVLGQQEQIPHASVQLDKAASAQRFRGAGCGGRKTKFCVRELLTTTLRRLIAWVPSVQTWALPPSPLCFHVNGIKSWLGFHGEPPASISLISITYLHQ